LKGEGKRVIGKYNRKDWGLQWQKGKGKGLMYDSSKYQRVRSSKKEPTGKNRREELEMESL